MARGKKGNQSANRREREELVRRAEAAELIAVRAYSERDAAAVKSTAEVESLRLELAKLREYVQQGSSPELVEARAQLAKRATATKELEARLDEWRKFWDKFSIRLPKAIQLKCGIPQNEIIDTLMGVAAQVAPADWLRTLRTYFDEVSRGRSESPLPPGATYTERLNRALVIDRARGGRRSADDLTEYADAWVVHRGNDYPRALIAMYSQRVDAESHAAFSDDLNFEPWMLLDTFDSPDLGPTNRDVLVPANGMPEVTD